MGKLQNFVDRARNHDIPRITDLNDHELAEHTGTLHRRFKWQAIGSLTMVGTGFAAAFVEVSQSPDSPMLAYGGVAVGVVSYVASCLGSGISLGIYSEALAERTAQTAEAARQAEVAEASFAHASAIISQIPNVGIG